MRTTRPGTMHLFPALAIAAWTGSTPALARGLNPDAALGRVTATCAPGKPKKTVYFFKQWHLEPSADTRLRPSSHPQDQNLESIYRQLDEWIAKKNLGAVIAEGCSGTIGENSPYRVNGWTVKDLISEVKGRGFAKIATSVPLKLKAKHSSRVEVACGDSEALVKEQLLAFSDARGDLGYLMRIAEHRNHPEKLKPYLNDVIEMLKLGKAATAETAIPALKADLKATVARIRDTLEKRNEALVKAILQTRSDRVAVVFGGMHADGVKRLLEKEGIGCAIIEPAGYRNDESDLLDRLDQALKEL